MNEQRIHAIFRLSIMLKGAHALIECFGGLVLAVVSTHRIVSMVERFTQDALIYNHHDVVASYLLGAAHSLSVQTKNFYAFYLLSHGAVKVGIVIALLQNRLWAYPVSLVALAGFIVYQIYRVALVGAVGLVVLTVFDLIVMALIWHEYRVVRRHPPTS
jgi:uncharacterized membrane protein